MENLTKTEKLLLGIYAELRVANYCELRMANGTQLEHQDIAIACWNEILKVFPSLKEILTETVATDVITTKVGMDNQTSYYGYVPPAYAPMYPSKVNEIRCDKQTSFSFDTICKDAY